MRHLDEVLGHDAAMRVALQRNELGEQPPNETVATGYEDYVAAARICCPARDPRFFVLAGELTREEFRNVVGKVGEGLLWPCNRAARRGS